MQFTLKRLFVAITACAFMLALYFGVASVFFNRLAITNNATQGATIDVTVWNQTITVKDLEPGRTSKRRFRSQNSDGGFHVVATFADGTSIQQADGYITGGSIQGERCVITISDDSITIE
jgi:hypothetical protein